MASRRSWTRDELVMAMCLYCRIPFGQLHHTNAQIVELAAALGRTPSSVSMKLCNFASLDPTLQARGIKGLTGASAADRSVWSEFHANWGDHAFEGERLIAHVLGRPLASSDEAPFPEGKDREALVKQRINQRFFRSSVLTAYHGRCCITGLEVAELLVASHVVPWSVDTFNRANPANGLCLNALHDKAFDRGLFSINDDHRVILSPRIARSEDTSPRNWLMQTAGSKIRMPERFAPDTNFIRWHRENVFQSS